MIRSTLAALLLLSSPARAEELTFDRCDAPAEAMARRGDEVRLECDAWIVNAPLHAELLRENQELKELVALLQARREASSEAAALYATLDRTRVDIEAINEKYFAQLSRKYDALDGLAAQANENTREAIRLSRALRRASYVTSGLVGGLAGAYTGRQLDGGWQAATGGAVAGVAVGALANWVVLRLTGLD
jgi:hypothetical protein